MQAVLPSDGRSSPTTAESHGAYVQDYQEEVPESAQPALEEGVGRQVRHGFVFYPPGAKPKDATGVTASSSADAQVLAVMDAVQARVSAKFEDSAKLG